MMGKIAFLFMLFIPLPVLAEGIFINEIAWMGTEESSNDEWLELYNPTETAISLDNWILYSQDGGLEITLSGNLPAEDYFLLERTNEETLPTISADQIYTGALSNSGESVFLKNQENEIVDSLDCSEGWLAGDNETKRTMERHSTDANDWQTSKDPGGTPKTENSQKPAEQEDQDIENPESSTPPETTSTANKAPLVNAGPNITALTGQEIDFNRHNCSDPDEDSLTFSWNFGDATVSHKENPSHVYAYPGEYIVSLKVSDGQLSATDFLKLNVYSGNIVISEFTPNPKGSDKESEWIEIHNQNSETINIGGWKIDDAEGGSSPFVLPDNTIISSNGHLVIQRTTSHIALNNQGDQVRLIYPNGDTAAEVNYQEDKEGLSIAKSGQNYFWTESPTPAGQNIISFSEEARKNFSANSFRAENYHLSKKPLKKTATKKYPHPLMNRALAEIVQLSPCIAYAQSPSPGDLTKKKTKNKPDNKESPKPTEDPIAKRKTSFASLASASGFTFFNKNPELILILSILISGSIFAGWGILMFKKN